MPSPQPPEYSLVDDVRLVIHFTRNWMQYGSIGFVMFCALMGAIQGVFLNG
jgi:hypothetical protein